MTEPSPIEAAEVPTLSPPARILVADDEPLVRELLVRVLQRQGYVVDSARDGAAAVRALDTADFDLIISDISMPNLGGIDLLKEVRRKDLDIPMILVTGRPEADTAIRALRYGALDYLSKPFTPQVILQTVRRGIHVSRFARLQRERRASEPAAPADLAGLEVRYDRALREMNLVFQPIVRWSTRSVFGYEALMRSMEPSLARPDRLLDAAERLGRRWDMGRRVRALAAEAALNIPGFLLVNIHPAELEDPELSAVDAPLAQYAGRVIFEITERERLDGMRAPLAAVDRLKRQGYGIAIDDLGAGYASLKSVISLKPDLVKVDMEIVRNVERDPVKQRLIQTLVSLTQDLGLNLVAEGVETEAECHALVELGCNLMQGFLFGRPRTRPEMPKLRVTPPELEFENSQP